MKPPMLQAKERDYVDSGYTHSDITDKIISVFFEVYNELGFGFLESVYERALCRALESAGMRVECQVPVPVWFRGEVIADFRADVVVEKSVIVELKAAQAIDASHLAQTLNYLRAISFEIGLVLNFGPKPTVRRLAFSNERKKISVHQR
jgi:GxxExxY protein